MPEPAATGPPTPPPHHGLDPISEAIGELKADVRTLTREVATLRSEMATKAELRVWGILLLLVLGGLFSAVVTLPQRLPTPAPGASQPAR